MKKSDEFYIGWMNAAPESFAKHVKKAVLAIFLLVLTAGVSLSLLQKRFSTSTFEYGQLTEVKGIYKDEPVPSIRIRTHADKFGNGTFITLPLVGYGKSGAEGTIRSLENEKKVKLEGREVTLKGMLIYSDGKTLLQIDKFEDPLVSMGETNQLQSVVKDLGQVELSGEIIDPKCYFGVMKPGQGKPHKDCAVRCIAGGISPVFYVRNEKGESNYYLILGENGNKLNDLLKDYIADPVLLKANAVQYDDWVILYIKDKSSIKRTGGLSWFKAKDNLVSCKLPHGK